MLYVLTAQGTTEQQDDVRALFEELVRGQRSSGGAHLASLVILEADGQATLYHDTDVPDAPAEVDEEEAGETAGPEDEEEPE